MKEVKIVNERLKTYLEFELDKEKEDAIYEEELQDIKQITVIGRLNEEKTLYNTLSDLTYFNNLKSCMIKDFLITDEAIKEINKLSKLEILHFDNCKFENKHKTIDISISNLIFSFCTNVNINLLGIPNSIKYLRITSGEEIELKGIEDIINIKKLYLQSLLIKDVSFISKLKNLEYLNLNGSKIVKNKKYVDELKVKVEYKKNNYPI